MTEDEELEEQNYLKAATVTEHDELYYAKAATLKADLREAKRKMAPYTDNEIVENIIFQTIPSETYNLRSKLPILEEVGDSPAFTPERYSYNQSNLEQFLQRFAGINGADSTLNGALHDALKQGGGKAFGLIVCDIIASRFNEVSQFVKLTVPRWKIVKKIISGEFKRSAEILRSSGLEEDWLDSASGTNKSQILDDQFLHSPDFEVQASTFNTPLILQEHRKGFGLVVDIAYDQIYQKVVVRVASGNK